MNTPHKLQTPAPITVPEPFPDFIFQRDPSATLARPFSLLQPMTRPAFGWVNLYVRPDATWWGVWLVIDNQYVAEILEQIAEAGLEVGR